MKGDALDDYVCVYRGKGKMTISHTRKQLIEKALFKSREVKLKFPTYFFWDTLERQLEYLLDLAENKTCDKSKLKNMTIGILTVREIEGLDEELSDSLYQVADMAEKMRWEK